MMEIDLNFLKTHYRRGLLCGPGENFESFFKRCSHKKLSQTFFFNNWTIDWAPIIYSDERLNWWEGACTWIDSCQAVLQFRHCFKTKERLWGIYSKSEILEHEMVHVCRLKFDEPVFEEILAYKTSKSAFRRFFGPLFRSPWETRLFIFLALGCWVPFLQWFIFPVLLGYISYSLWRLIRHQRIFLKVQKKIKTLIKGPSFPFMLSLSDQEFFFFARAQIEEIQSYIDKQSCVRWHQIRAVYFN